MPKYPMYYLLDEQGNPYPTEDSHAVEALLGAIDKRRVAVTEGTYGHHKMLVSTVFLVIDHNFRITPEEKASPPILYETLLFIDGNTIGNSTRRYETKEQALEGHKDAASLVDIFTRSGMTHRHRD
jgi:hypothetical protein